jgi:hypothetical protein
MIVAFWANLKVPFDDLPIDDLVTGVAFHPKMVRGLRLLSFLFLFFILLKPGHPRCSSSPFRSLKLTK